MHLRSRQLLFLVFVALVGLGAGLYLALRGTGGQGPTHAPSPGTVLGASPAEAPRYERSESPSSFAAPAGHDPEMLVKEGEGRTRQTAPTTVANSVPAHATSGEAPNAQPTAGLHPTVEFMTHDRAPVAGLAVMISMRPYQLGQPQAPAHESAALTDSQGRVAVPEFGPHVFVRVTAEGWRAAGAGTKDQDWRAVWARRTTVTVEQFFQLEVRARYADGLPYTGRLGVQALWEEEVAESRPLVFQRYEIRDGAAEIEPLAGVAFRVSAETRRPHFKNAAVTVGAEAKVSDAIELVLEYDPDPRNGMIEIDLSAFDPQESLYISATWAGPFPSTEYSTYTQGGGVHVTSALYPYTYRVFVRNDPDRLGPAIGIRGPPRDTEPAKALAWTIEVEVHAAQITRVTAQPQVSAAVRARLVDQNGKPLMPGRIFVETGSKYPVGWAEVLRDVARALPGTTYSRHRHGRGYTGTDGEAVLLTVVPGKRVLAAEAPGFDIKFIEADLSPGEILDLGTITLAPATGVIEVEVTNWVADTKYYVHLRGPGGGSAVIEPRACEGPTCRVDGFSHRYYAVYVGYSADFVPSFFVGNIMLTADEPYVKVQFEMPRGPPLPTPGAD
jgi:hypothetical protein